jgi:hypothetical protein
MSVIAEAMKSAGYQSPRDQLNALAREAIERSNGNRHVATGWFLALIRGGMSTVAWEFFSEHADRAAEKLLHDVFVATQQNDGGGERHTRLGTQYSAAPTDAVTPTPAGAARSGQMNRDAHRQPAAPGDETRASAGGEGRRNTDTQCSRAPPANPPRDLSAARAARSVSYGQMIATQTLIQGVPLMQSTVRAVKEWGLENAARAAFAEEVTANLPDGSAIGVHRDFDFIGAAWKRTHGIQ